MSVAAGETVRWFNDDALPHTVTAADRSWDSGNLPPGASFERRFDVAGNYQYLCRYRSGMVGTIAEDVLTGDSAELFVAVVTAASLDLDLTRRPHPQG